MTHPRFFVAMDRSQAWYAGILRDHLKEAKSRVDEVLAEAKKDRNGCLVTPTKGPRKIRFMGGQDRAYRFVYCVLNGLAATRDQVVRHRCHNRRCVNPEHLEIGTREDNARDERERQANGVDWSLL